MTHRSASLLLAVLLAAIFPDASTARNDRPPAVSERPNVVFLYADDLARWGVGAYGNREVRTPNVDRLAGEGALLTHAFTCTPVCSPSRAGMFASRFPTQLGIDDWIDPRSEPDLGLSPRTITWPKLLQSAGYTTGLFGKWHLGTRPEFEPSRNGYGTFFGFLGGGTTPMNPTLDIGGKSRKVQGSLPDLLVDEALRFLDANREGPFLLSVHFRAPHQPYAPVPDVDSAPFRDLDPTIPDYPDLPIARVKKLTKEYYASIHSIDRNVGRLLDRLDAAGLARNTIVVFMSDHGYMIGQHGLWHKGNGNWIAEGHSGRRPNMFDDALRVPLIVRWPAVIRAGARVDAVVSNMDLFPTLLDLVGLGTAENLKLEGRSFAGWLRGEEPPYWDTTIYGQYDMHHGGIARMRMIRTPEWKLVRRLDEAGLDELYDLKNDPGERTNLAGTPEFADRAETLKLRLLIRMLELDDRSAVDDPRDPRP